MRARSLIVWVTTMSLLAGASPVLAQQHVVTPSALQAAVDQQVATDRANRATVSRVLARDDVRQTAERLGLDVRQATQALGQLSGSDLAELAGVAQAAEADLAGGQRTITISVTTLLIVLLIILLVAD
jgi:hypothetical protein